MTDASLKPLIDAARAYQSLFVPALFQEWAPRVVSAARVRPGHRVLDVACGTGVLARESAAHAGTNGSVAGLDPGPGMLAVAAELAPDITWREGTAESLPFPDGSFDAVVSQFGLMFFPDRHRAVEEMMRVLVPGGRLGVAVWDSLENTPTYAAMVTLLERRAGRPAADALRAPYALGDRRKLAALFEDGGLTSVSVTTHSGTGRFPSVRAMVEADLRGWLPVMGIALPEDLIGSILAEAEGALKSWVTAEGRVEFDTPAHIVTGVR